MDGHSYRREKAQSGNTGYSLNLTAYSLLPAPNAFSHASPPQEIPPIGLNPSAQSATISPHQQAITDPGPHRFIEPWELDAASYPQTLDSGYAGTATGTTGTTGTSDAFFAMSPDVLLAQMPGNRQHWQYNSPFLEQFPPSPTNFHPQQQYQALLHPNPLPINYNPRSLQNQQTHPAAFQGSSYHGHTSLPMPKRTREDTTGLGGLAEPSPHRRKISNSSGNSDHRKEPSQHSSYPNAFTSQASPDDHDHQIRSSYERPAVARPPKFSTVQMKMIQQWHQEFFQNLPEQEYCQRLKGLAFSIGLQPAHVSAWIAQKLREADDTDPLHLSNPSSEDDIVSRVASRNRHLGRDVLTHVQDYIRGCLRQRSGSDGRRTKNTGQYVCTHQDCGYHTERSFDWKRHEEIHQPQNLWLCVVCRREGNPSPFLVNRRDKLLKHAKKEHPRQSQAQVGDLSRLEYHPVFDGKCPHCDQVFRVWKERCNHLINHFDGKIEGCPQPSSELDEDQPSEGVLDDDLNPLENDASESDDDAPGSSDTDNDSDDPGDDSNDGSGTGGSAGASQGTQGGQTQYRSGWAGSSGQGNESFQYYTSSGGNNWGCAKSVFDGKLSGHHPARPGLKGQSLTVTKSLRLSASSSSLGKRSRSGQLLALPMRFEAETMQQRHRANLIFKSRTRSHSSGKPWCPPFLGRGAHGTVDVVRQGLGGQFYARKRSWHPSFPREIQILKNLNHPHIIEFITAYMQDSALSLIMSPIAQSTLKQYLDASADAVEHFPHVQNWFGCLSSALAYLHSQRIRHADIKPQNILVRDTDIFISDFGISRVVATESTSDSISPLTPLYAALEIAERRPHGRRADVFSLGCVLVELMTVAQGSTIKDFHGFLSFTRADSGRAHAYYKKHEELVMWINVMRQGCRGTMQRLWDICECMVRNDVSFRPCSYFVLGEVRNALQAGTTELCEDCQREAQSSRIVEITEEDEGMPATIPSLPHSEQLDDVRRLPPRRSLSCISDCVDNPPGISASHKSADPDKIKMQNPGSAILSCSEAQRPPSTIPYRCFCPGTRRNKKRSEIMTGLAEVLDEYEDLVTDPFSFHVPDFAFAYTAVFLSPPPYDGSVGPVTISVNYGTIRLFEAQSQDSMWGISRSSQAQDETFGRRTLGDSFERHSHDGKSSAPRGRCKRSCHMCGTSFVAPRLNQCRRCSHFSCERCPPAPSDRCQDRPRKAESELLTAIGSHLSPPAYSLHDGGSSPSYMLASGPTTLQHRDMQTEETVFRMVMAQNAQLGDDPGTRFIQEPPSLFDRLQDSNQDFSQHCQPQQPFLTIEDSNSHAPSEGSITTPEEPNHKRLKLGSDPNSATSSEHPPSRRYRLNLRQRLRNTTNRRGYPRAFALPRGMGESKAASESFHPQDSFHQLETLQARDTYPASMDPTMSALPRLKKSKSTSTDSTHSLSRLPSLRRAHRSTSSSLASNPVARLPIIRTIASTSSADSHAQGEFNKPQPHHTGRPRSSSSHSNKEKEFRYYGRHTNSWLFNDFSVMGTAKKAYKFVAGEKGHGGQGDEEM